MSFDMTSIHAAFFEEAGEMLDGFEEHLLSLESAPEDSEILNSIFRCAHSIKGGAATFGFPDLAKFTHSLESLLEGVRSKAVAVTQELCQLLLESLDQMKLLLAVAKGEPVDIPPSDSLIARIDAAAKKTVNRSEAEGEQGWGLLQEPKIYELTFRPHTELSEEGHDPLLVIGRLSKIGKILTASCDTSGVPDIEDLKPETCYLTWSIMLQSLAEKSDILALFADVLDHSEVVVYLLGGEPPAEVEQPDVVDAPADPGKTVAPQSAHKDGGTIKVSSEKLDTLINLVGELVISQSMLNSVTQDFDTSKMPQLLEAVAAMERSSRELQERVMGIRLLQMKMAFGRFPRLVHDLSSSVGKRIDLRLIGEETELDKNLIEAIGDPLTHLVRNSIDHGLETPEERLKFRQAGYRSFSVGASHEAVIRHRGRRRRTWP